mmetsp:Transcript_44051/g.121934  ORF Transcript_44051/g.121934 Transcript_44051/m.121934 type:complete len:318 (+) Transcript_44051:68-1021(+)
MGNVDGVPVASQVKSLVQVSRGDADGARETQLNFTERCIGAAQVRSFVEVARGDVESAAETQKRFLAHSRRILGRNDFVDAVPLVAQLKSFAQAAEGDQTAAMQTQQNFTKHCPVVSQAMSAYDYAMGRKEEAAESQREFLSFASKSLDRMPGLGHAKALLHHSLGDDARAEAARTQANRASEHGLQLFSAAVQDIFLPRAGRSSGDANAYQSSGAAPSSDRHGSPDEEVYAAAGPLNVLAIREHTLCLNIAPEQVASHGACPICMEDFVPHELVRTLRCFHLFHSSCAEQWLKENGNCPVCRVAAVPTTGSYPVTG